MLRFVALVLTYLMATTAMLSTAIAEDQAISINPSLAVIGKAPQFTLFDTSGKPTRLADYRGRVVLVAFVFTTCPGVCPLISKQMSVLQTELKKEKLFGRKAGMLSITVDPETDTPDVLAEYATTYDADASGWKFLYDTPEKMKPIYRAYDEWTKKTEKGQLDHPARVYLVDAKGNIREIYSLAFFSEKQALLDIKALLREQS